MNEIRQQVIELRKHGFSFDEIAIGIQAPIGRINRMAFDAYDSHKALLDTAISVAGSTKRRMDARKKLKTKDFKVLESIGAVEVLWPDQRKNKPKKEQNPKKPRPPKKVKLFQFGLIMNMLKFHKKLMANMIELIDVIESKHPVDCLHSATMGVLYVVHGLRAKAYRIDEGRFFDDGGLIIQESDVCVTRLDEIFYGIESKTKTLVDFS